MKNRRTIEAVGIITQARMTSTRLPGKILMKIKGKTLLEYHIERLKWAGLPIIVATTTNDADDPVVSLAERLNVLVFRGDEEDVLSRYFLATKKYGLKTVVRVTSDCPFIDGNMITRALDEFTDCDYLSTDIIPSFPNGFGFEIVSFEALEEAFQNATEVPEREHVTPYIYYTHRHLFKIKAFSQDRDNSGLRVTVDTEDDFELIREMIEKHECHKLSAYDIISVLEKNPYLKGINTHVRQKQYGE